MTNKGNKDIAQQIDNLELRLAGLAYYWRGANHRRDVDTANVLVAEYHQVMAELWKLGWDGTGLLPDSELPPELMPAYFRERWKDSSF